MPDNSVIADGLAAWRRGDLNALEHVLDPAVTLRAIAPGPWDCENRAQVMALLRARQREHPERAAAADVTVEQLNESTFRVSGIGGPTGTATLVTVTAGKVTALQQVSTEPGNDQATAALAAIRAGDTDALQRLLDRSPQLARGPIPGFQGRTLLHIVTDWPGYWPNGVAVVHIIAAHGADPNHRGADNTDGETPLHWAASSDDADVAAALLDIGADPAMPGGSIGTPLDNAIGYGCWAVARLLVARGAPVDKIWHAAALGMSERLDELLTDLPQHAHEDSHPDPISQGLWHACAAGQRRTAERLLTAGADLNWTPDYAEGTALDAARGQDTQRSLLIDWLTTLHPD